MIRKAVCALFILSLCVGVTLADEIRGMITKVGDGKITITEFKAKGEKGEAKTFSIADNVKVVKSKFNKETKKSEAGDPIEGGLKNEMFTKLGEKGKFGTVITNADNKVTEVRVSDFGGFKKKPN